MSNYRIRQIYLNKMKKLGRKPVSENDFLIRAKNIHGEKFLYDLSKYIDIVNKIDITCLKCGKIFSQNPFSHLSGSGCKNCAMKKESKRKTIIAGNLFWSKVAISRYKNYDLSKAEYSGSSKKIEVSCRIHGKEFKITAGNFIKGNGGCKECAKKSPNLYQNIRSKECANNFIERASAKHNHKYDYSKCEYINSSKKVIIICKDHGEFLQIPSDHLRNGGCSACSKSGFSELKPGTLYYVKIFTEIGIFYKIGITNLSVKDRFKKHKNKIIILMKKEFLIGKFAQDEEKSILKKYKKHRYSGKDVIPDGNTELFCFDILGLDI